MLLGGAFNANGKPREQTALAISAALIASGSMMLNPMDIQHLRKLILIS